ncbi:ASCH domain-containing protein [Chryseobacterium sp. SNU WT5]|uniref:ASCH domain-containing protein n=1 Tax=Chryseobacterium sp. SNU WT5 TaxID=2594269 RepID=UPI0011808C4D|nr:ASCH domain-containing protein [Chryseobacterium sp. SNU WT5]QDP86052.1 ASCH domain-containing protein [Chryseobacterium sp. SNU WT5]
MKALSIKQPWASLIAHGIKDIENRTWKTNFRGRIYIHASGTKVLNGLRVLTEEQYVIAQKIFLENGFDKFSDLPVSAIIGEVEIVDCVINHSSIWAEETELPEQLGNQCIWNWVLANPILYKNPILNVKGKLSFWEPDNHLEECIWCSGRSNFEEMIQDAGDNHYCPECWKEAEPILQAEYDEMIKNGEIDPLEANGFSFETGV